MLHALGRKQRKEGDLVDALVECHDRIRTFIDLAVAVSVRTDISRAEIAEGAARVDRYFTRAFPLHVADEESSLLPRLRGRSSRIDAALARMHEQHQLHHDMIERVCVHATTLRVEPRDRAARDALAVVAGPLRSILRDHMEAEEQILFPAVRELFSPADERLVRREMEDRRRVDG